MIIAGCIAALLVVVLLFRQSKRRMARMGAFVEKAIQRYAEDGNPVALLYILIAYAACTGTEKYRVVKRPIYLDRLSTSVRLLEVAGLDMAGSPSTKKDVIVERLNKLEEQLDSQGWGVKEGLQLRKQLTQEQFTAWRRFDLAIFDRIEHAEEEKRGCDEIRS